MPELPEMETYRKLVSQEVLDLPIQNVIVNREKSINIESEQFIKELVGRKIIFVERRGKYLVFHLDNGGRLLLHLRLGGLMYVGMEEDRPDRNTQINIEFAGKTLYFIGLRLGFLHLLSAKQVDEELADLGPDPFDRRLTEDRFVSLLQGRRGSLKTTLINQHIISGIGNCYSDEIAFAAELRPDVKLQDLSEESLRRLYTAMRSVLTEAIEGGGYMELPLTVHDQLTGGYNDQCKVYDREGEPCVRCGTAVVKTEISGHKAFYCPNCQHDH
ncbi:bifunctional DNA-formamidopyrimidine glycosylase/DNA-(apurinic or apyrimidinic site) lyase [Paenibacillus sediminis]|uniref:Formamidopyrimidine-DNA glycosylase n=1 Tax=Paenibacillus sediminis TaxID=664909 RepID=A0ABS4H0B1_9BACL|nr:bifunctional DNA-formamidopyrimidine glycosylase/DNA-(apurinic or apyrimidinic site) lyase [Paenibacillus sediminis]MBP1935901.1 formamidopyrimidine-DNA glycosylase [Paenibacillus sediminis]